VIPSWFRRLIFSLSYLGHAPWDSGIVPPEVEAFLLDHPAQLAIRKGRRTSSGNRRALDLGCGSGTSSLALARAGWEVTGVDFAASAIRIARRKARQAGLTVDFRLEDVLRMHALHGPFDLVLDIGCYHSLSVAQRVDYLHNLDRLLAPEATWLLYAFFRPETEPGPGLEPFDLELIDLHLKLEKRTDGVDKKSRPSAWFWYRK
jgi:SAM-dependent methyltransferase